MVVDLPAGRRDHAAGPAPVRTSRALLAYAVDFERESPPSLALSANVVRVLDEEGVLVRDIPGCSGISKEATSMAPTYLVKSRHVGVDGTTAATKSARLTPDGRAAGALFPALHADLEKQWRARFGGDTVRGLRSSLERMLGQREVVANGLEPYPDGWRASKPYVGHTRAVLDDRPRGCHTARWCSIAAAGPTGSSEPRSDRRAACPECGRERPVRRARTENERAREIDVVSTRERQWQPWQRRATPARRRPSGVRADRMLDLP